VGAITTCMAGASALFEKDIKKVVALSTLRQLGVMFFSLGVGAAGVAFSHLISHAYFKAILFIAAGSVIHGVKDYQDTRKMGARNSSLSFLIGVILVGNLRLCGLPFISGFYSKDIVVELCLSRSQNFFIFLILITGVALTVGYSCRMALGIYGAHPKRDRFRQERDASNLIIMGIRVLILPSVVGG